MFIGSGSSWELCNIDKAHVRESFIFRFCCAHPKKIPRAVYLEGRSSANTATCFPRVVQVFQKFINYKTRINAAHIRDAESWRVQEENDSGARITTGVFAEGEIWQSWKEREREREGRRERGIEMERERNRDSSHHDGLLVSTRWVKRQSTHI